MSGTSNILSIVSSFRNKLWQYKLKLIDRNLTINWSKWIINPIGNYLEIENCKPVLLTEIDWVEINLIESKWIGKLVPNKIIDHSSEICKLLDELGVEYLIDNGIIKIKNLR